jgi:RNA 3'-terminal phosphate cyclase
MRSTKGITDDQIRAAWDDDDTSLGESARRLGITRQTLVTRARRMGLPPRAGGEVTFQVFTIQIPTSIATAEDRLARAMALSARETNARLAKENLCDHMHKRGKASA